MPLTRCVLDQLQLLSNEAHVSALFQQHAAAASAHARAAELLWAEQCYALAASEVAEAARCLADCGMDQEAYDAARGACEMLVGAGRESDAAELCRALASVRSDGLRKRAPALWAHVEQLCLCRGRRGSRSSGEVQF
eukprot:m51a1_g9595 hypothetical protein (137) ;mRNA; r:1032777-1033187